jgi:hypothetical protein
LKEEKKKERTGHAKRFLTSVYLYVSKKRERKFIQDVRQYELFLFYALVLALWRDEKRTKENI